MALTLISDLALHWTHTSPLDLSTPTDDKKLTEHFKWTNGGGADQAQYLWHDQRTLTTGASENLDLAGGLTDAYGTTLTFATVKLIFARAASANTTTLTFGGGSNPFQGPFDDTTDQVNLVAGGIWLITNPAAAGWTVTAGTGDILAVTNSAGASATYDIVIIGD